MLRYFVLAVPQLLAQVVLTHGAYMLLHIGNDQILVRTLIHVAVMCVLFVASFMIQQRWVFAQKKTDKNNEDIML